MFERGGKNLGGARLSFNVVHQNREEGHQLFGMDSIRVPTMSANQRRRFRNARRRNLVLHPVSKNNRLSVAVRHFASTICWIAIRMRNRTIFTISLDFPCLLGRSKYNSKTRWFSKIFVLLLILLLYNKKIFNTCQNKNHYINDFRDEPETKH